MACVELNSSLDAIFTPKIFQYLSTATHWHSGQSSVFGSPGQSRSRPPTSASQLRPKNVRGSQCWSRISTTTRSGTRPWRDCSESTLCLKWQALPGWTDGLSQQTEPEQSQPWRDGDGPARHEGETQERHPQQRLRCKFTEHREAVC